jgi:photosystem II stability/assembly factor-like uncharacterized protein
MGTIQNFIRVCMLGAMTVSTLLAAQPSITEPDQLSATLAPIVSLEFDDVSPTLWKATPRSLARSLNEGRTWLPVRLPSWVQGNILSFKVSAGRAKTLYVVVVGSGVLSSRDGGRSWVARNHGLPGGTVVALAPHSAQPRTIYAYIDGKGIFRSHNAGAVWRLVNHGPHEPVSQLAHSTMPSETGTGWLFAATRTGVHRAMDCFCGWKRAGQLALGSRAVSSDAALPERIYAAAGDGLFISPDGGDHWTRMRSPVAPITALASTPSGRLYGAIRGNVIRSNDRGVTWEYIDR